MTQTRIIPSTHPDRDVIPALRRASKATGVNFDFLVEQARIESSLNPQAHAPTSSARGLFQFIDGTWLEVVEKHGAKHGLGSAATSIERDASGLPVVRDPARRAAILKLREDPYISGLMAGELALDNAARLQEKLGRAAKPVELYMAHFLGAGGAAAFLGGLQQHPGVDASEIVPVAARANQSVFYQEGKALSLDQVYASFEGKFGGGRQVKGDSGISGLNTPDEVARFAEKVASTPVKAAGLAALSGVSTGTGNPAMSARDHGTRESTNMQTATSQSVKNHAPYPRDKAAFQHSPTRATLFALQLMQSMALPESEEGAASKRTWRA
jgi:hypothetical protein